MLRNGMVLQSYIWSLSATSACGRLSGGCRGCGVPPASKTFSKAGVCCHMAATCSAHLRASQRIAAHLSTSQHLESRNLLFDRGSVIGVTGCEWLQGNMRCSWLFPSELTQQWRRPIITQMETTLRHEAFLHILVQLSQCSALFPHTQRAPRWM